MPTIWRAPDELWTVVERVLREVAPPKRTGRQRIDPRGALDAIIFRLRSGCQWNRLPKEYPDDSSVHCTVQRRVRVGLIDRIWPVLLEMFGLLKLACALLWFRRYHRLARLR